MLLELHEKLTGIMISVCTLIYRVYIYIHTPCRSLLTLPSGLLVGRFCDRQRNALQHWLTSISKLANCSFDPVPPVAASC